MSFTNHDLLNGGSRSAFEASHTGKTPPAPILCSSTSSAPLYKNETNHTVLFLFDSIVSTHPEEEAVRYGDQVLTYRELDGISNRLANYLRNIGLREDNFVPICMERSLEMVIGILGILKAGGAYVPIDPNSPTSQIQHIFRETHATWILGHRATYSKTAGIDNNAKTIEWESIQSSINEQSESCPRHHLEGTHLAYAIFTSGSTGVPKGVLVEHSQLFNATKARGAYYTSFRNTLLIPSFSFDASLAAIFGSLCSGGCLIICEQEDLQHVPRLEQLLSQLDTLLCVPSYYQFLLDEGLLRHTKLSKVILGGEAVSTSLVLSHFEQNGKARLYNEYGPTETTIWATVEEIKSADSPITIGMPIDGVEAYVLDPEGKLLDENQVGELYIGGKSVARGYLNDPEGTAAKFIANPIRTSPSRLYKTGDLCYRLRDGKISFVGRADTQVKVNGYRIEIGQIESALLQMSNVRQAAVIAKDAKPSGKYLVAFVQLSGSLNTKSLQAQLRAVLPDYMIPNHWVQLDDFPLTSNGKVDRQALQTLEPEDALGTLKSTLTDPVEAALWDLWTRHLPTQPVSVDDDFFNLGGNSVMAMRLVAAIRRELKCDLRVSIFFQQSNIAQLARWIKSMPNGVGEKTEFTIDHDEQPEQSPGLSYGQESLWLIDQLGQGKAYHLTIALRVEGDLDREALTLSIRNLIQRHEPLRTTIRGPEDAKQPYHLCSDDWDFARAEEGLQPRDLDDLIKQPFDLSRDFMIRAWLLPVNTKENTLLFVIHHIAFDAWSKSIFLDELWKGYHAFTTKSPLTLQPLPLDYTTYALRQKSSSNAFTPKLAYWKDKLKGFSPLQLPKDHVASDDPMEGTTKTFSIPGDLLTKIKNFSRGQGATTFMTLLTAFKILLHRYSSQEDILIGTAMAGREEPGTESLIGYFVNSLPLRTEVKRTASFIELLKNVKQTTLEAYDAKEAPFDMIVAEGAAERNARQHPYFQVMFNFNNVPQPDRTVNDSMAISFLEVAQTTSKFDLTFSLSEAADGIEGEVEFRTSIYRPSTIDRMIQHYLLLLKNGIQQPTLKIAKLPMITEEEQQLLQDFNQTSKAYPPDETILHLLERQVKKTPDQTAAIFEDQKISYKTLNEKSNQLAHLLIEKGAGAETPVLLCMRRSLDLVIAVLGILKAGAAYVPIDPEYPHQRKKFIIEDTAAPLAVTDSENEKELAGSNSELIVLEEGAANLTYLVDTEIETVIRPDQLAYIIYTSGSTGTPKGVMIEHQNVHSFISWCIEEFSSCPSKVVYAATSICFDLSVFEFFYSLCTGTPFRLLRNGLEIQHYLPQDEHVMINTVPSVVAHLLDEKVDLSDVSAINMAGEPISKNILNRLDVEQMEVRNLYGPTEDTTYSTVYRVGQEREILIGQPISNTGVHIIDQEYNLTPIGVPGEICLSGAGLARGYFNRADLTKEKFVTNAPVPKSGGRIYKTGDIGRWLPNGQIEYLGRKDDQVKIRGYRIELGEIEWVLQQHAAVKQAVVLAKKDQKENQHLVSYLVTEGPLDRHAIIDFLRQKLPSYMVPTLWVKVDTFPLSPNGKVDKKRLPDPLQENLPNHAFVAPRTKTEKMLADTWKELLHTDRVGIHDDFFAIGGTSLLVTRFMVAVRQVYDIDFGIRDVFDFPTIAGLTQNFKFRKKQVYPAAIRVITPRPEPLPLSYNQESLWIIDQLSGSTHYHIPIVLRLEGKLDVQAVSLSLRSIISRHEVLRTVIQHKEGVPHQVIKDVRDWQIEEIDGRPFHNDGSKIQEIIEATVDRPFDLSQDYMLRGFLIQLDNTQHLMGMVVHHIAFDGWSTSLLLTELADSYQCYREGKKPTWELPAIQYADFAIWQKQLLQGELLQRKISFWKKKLLNVAALKLPVDYPKAGIPSYNGSVETLQIDKALNDQLSTLGERQSATLFMALLTTFKMLLSHYSGQEDICVGTVTTGRQEKELEKLLGYFAQTLPIRSHLPSDATFFDLLRTVKTNTLEALENQELPFERIVTETQAHRNLNENPLFQVLFLFQNFPEVTSFPLNDIKVTVQPVHRRTSKFDMSFIISETSSGLRLEIEYNIHLFKQETIKRLGADYIRLLNAIASNPRLKFKEYFPLDGAEAPSNQKRMDHHLPSDNVSKDLLPPLLSDLDSTQKIVSDIWKDALDREVIGINDNFFELGGQSLVAVQVMSQLEKKLGTKLPLSVLFKHPTVEEMAQVIEQTRGTNRRWKSLVPIQASGTKPPLYMVHGGGASILPFYGIAKNMDPNQPVYGLQPKGMDGKESPLGTVESIASHFIQEIVQHNPEGPINLAGYSFGGIVAFEMARQLKSIGREVQHLVMFDTIAYQNDLEAKATSRLKKKIKRSVGSRAFDLQLLINHPQTFKKIKRDSLKNKLKRLRSWARVEKREPENDMMKTIRLIEASHRQAAEKYKLTPYDGVIYLMKAKIPTYYHGMGRFLGWDKYVNQIHIEEMEGEHTTMFASPNDVGFAQSLQKILETR